MRRQRLKEGLTSGALLAALLFAVSLSVSPQLHERIHPDAASSDHECAVTLIASGKYQHSAAPVLVVAPQPPVEFSNVPALHPVWVESPFLGACIFEHAPPARS